MAHSAGGKDFYKILNVSRTATTHEIKSAYRKLAMALHPDVNDNCQEKAKAFKAASEAYNTLSDHSKRTSYDSLSHNYNSQTKRRAPPPNYRKVYSPRAPPGFKTFDKQRHFDMHYGEGMMMEEIERARRRAQRASGRDSSYDYQSPLGEGFSFESKHDSNPYSKRARQGPPPNGGGLNFEYEEAHYYDMDGSDLGNARRVVRQRESVRERMDERRKNRIERRNRQQQPKEEAGCSVM